MAKPVKPNKRQADMEWARAKLDSIVYDDKFLTELAAQLMLNDAMDKLSRERMRKRPGGKDKDGAPG